MKDLKNTLSAFKTASKESQRQLNIAFELLKSTNNYLISQNKAQNSEDLALFVDSYNSLLERAKKGENIKKDVDALFKKMKDGRKNT